MRWRGLGSRKDERGALLSRVWNVSLSPTMTDLSSFIQPTSTPRLSRFASAVPNILCHAPLPFSYPHPHQAMFMLGRACHVPFGDESSALYVVRLPRSDPPTFPCATPLLADFSPSLRAPLVNICQGTSWSSVGVQSSKKLHAKLERSFIVGVATHHMLSISDFRVSPS